MDTRSLMAASSISRHWSNVQYPLAFVVAVAYRYPPHIPTKDEPPLPITHLNLFSDNLLDRLSKFEYLSLKSF